MKKVHKKIFDMDREDVAFLFLGVGLTMFLLNITTIINMMITWGGVYSLTSYFVSSASSILIILYSVYNIYAND